VARIFLGSILVIVGVAGLFLPFLQGRDRRGISRSNHSDSLPLREPQQANL